MDIFARARAAGAQQRVLLLHGLETLVEARALLAAARIEQARPAPSPHFVPGLPHVTMLELRQVLNSYQD